jgi:hypothetical protein
VFAYVLHSTNGASFALSIVVSYRHLKAKKGYGKITAAAQPPAAPFQETLEVHDV